MCYIFNWLEILSNTTFSFDYDKKLKLHARGGDMNVVSGTDQLFMNLWFSSPSFMLLRPWFQYKSPCSDEAEAGKPNQCPYQPVVLGN
jgi:hypothetical protein